MIFETTIHLIAIDLLELIRFVHSIALWRQTNKNPVLDCIHVHVTPQPPIIIVGICNYAPITPHFCTAQLSTCLSKNPPPGNISIATRYAVDRVYH